MEQTADLLIKKDPEEAILLMTGSVNRETDSGVRYLILDQDEITNTYPTTA